MVVDLRSVFTALRVRWWMVGLGLAVGVVSAVVVSLAATRQYTTDMQFFVSTTDSGSTTEVFQGSQFAQQRVASYSELLQGDLLAGRIVDELDLDETTESLRSRIEAAPVPETVLIEASVTDESAEQAQRIAETLAAQFVDLVEELETPANATESTVRVALTDSPGIPARPSEPNPLRNIALGLACGLLAGALAAVGREYFDRSVKQPDEVVALTGVPVIGTVLRSEALEKNQTIDRMGEGRGVEDYRQLRTNLQFLDVDEPPKVIMISSAMPSEGKTTAVVNLALALADSGRRVTVIEADLRRPKVTRYLGLVGDVGLTNILAGTADLEDVVQRYGDRDLRVVASGPMPPNPGEVLASSHMLSLLDKLRGDNDFVLVDAPPLLPVADTSGLAVSMDAVLLSVRYGSTRKDQLQQAAATLDRVGARHLGVILSMVPPKTELASAYGYGPAYGQGRHSAAGPSR
ncbi:polysaccharide biosynthesis tyrosine autokinase [Geodermatophilus sp. CPCC 206100]|uniref:polysaccharide biosynthesis tyrosine autokinase n=1 Tax=Geodermatophilus sp. CPCC 206100 TaxID=3020054 RepID=UPI003AFFCDD0